MPLYCTVMVRYTVFAASAVPPVSTAHSASAASRLRIDFPMFSASLCEKVFQRAGEQGGGVPPFSTPPENKKSVQARQKSRPYTEFHTKVGYVKMQKKHNARGQNTREVLYSDGASYIIRVRCGVMPLCMVVSAPAQVMGCCSTP